MLTILNIFFSDIRKFINKHKIITIYVLYYSIIFNKVKVPDKSFFKNILQAFKQSIYYIFIICKIIIPKLLILCLAILIIFCVLYPIYRYILSLLYRKANKLNNGNFSCKVFIKNKYEKDIELMDNSINNIKLTKFTSLEDLKTKLQEVHDYLNYKNYKNHNTYYFKIYYHNICIFYVYDYDFDKFIKKI